MNVLVICLCISFIFAANSVIKPADTADICDDAPEISEEDAEIESAENKQPMDAKSAP